MLIAFCLYVVIFTLLSSEFSIDRLLEYQFIK